MESIELQQQFFSHIRSRLPSHVSFVDEVADLLEISNDSAYRRIRGEKPISFEEIQKLCRKFHVSLDHIFSIDSNSTVFFGNWVDAQNFDFENYLTDMHSQLSAISKAENKVLYFEAKDIPPFHHFQFSELASFKYFFWMKTILSYPAYSKTCFEDSDLKEILKKTGMEIIRTYNNIPSVEIWSAETINSTIRQIEFYRESGAFKNQKTVSALYDELNELINHIEKQAETGEKFLVSEEKGSTENSFRLFFNEVFLGHNTIMTETDGKQTVFINHGVLNYMITRDRKFCEYTKKSFENTMRKSSLISSVNEKERHRFFHLLRDKIARKKN